MRPEHKHDPSDHLGALISVVSFERQDLVAELLTEADVKTLKHLARKGTPENSLRALTSDLAYLEAWCLAATGTVLPWPSPEALALKFVAHTSTTRRNVGGIRITACRQTSRLR